MDIAALRQDVRQRMLLAAAADERVSGVVDYGATAAGRADRWSDLDLALFVRNADLPTFERDWPAWAAQFGPLLLAYVGGVGHPWAIYDADPLPLRVDLAFYPEAGLQEVCSWPLAPERAADIVLFDDTGGALTSAAQTLVGKSLAPRDPARAFTQVAGDFWYYLLRTYTKIGRGDLWAARHDFNFVVVGNLHALLRLEAARVDHWRGRNAAVGLERDIAPERLAALNAACIPGPAAGDLVDALRRTAELGHEVCTALVERETLAFPEPLMVRVRQTLTVDLAD